MTSRLGAAESNTYYTISVYYLQESQKVITREPESNTYNTISGIVPSPSCFVSFLICEAIEKKKSTLFLFCYSGEQEFSVFYILLGPTNRTLHPELLKNRARRDVHLFKIDADTRAALMALTRLQRETRVGKECGLMWPVFIYAFGRAVTELFKKSYQRHHTYALSTSISIFWRWAQYILRLKSHHIRSVLGR